MSVEMRAYDNEHGDPVVVMVTTGTYDVSRLVGLLAKGRCEDHDLSGRIVQSVRRHNGGRAALKLLRDHGGADFTDEDPAAPNAYELQIGRFMCCTEPVSQSHRPGCTRAPHPPSRAGDTPDLPPRASEDSAPNTPSGDA